MGVSVVGANGSKTGRSSNNVHADAIWRQTIRYELNTAKNYDTHWGFMKAPAHQTTQSSPLPSLPSTPLHSSARQPTQPSLPPISNASMSGLPSVLGSRLGAQKEPILDDWMYAYNVHRIVRFRYPCEKYGVPPTTSSEVGWPWLRTQKALGMPYPPTTSSSSSPVTITTAAVPFTTTAPITTSPPITTTTNTISSSDANLTSGTISADTNSNDTSFRIEAKRNRFPAAYTLERYPPHTRRRGNVLDWFGAREALP